MRLRLFARLAVRLVACLLSACASVPSITARPATSMTTTGGVIVETLQEGIGLVPGPTDTVRVHYVGTFEDGREFDSTHARGRPAEIPLARVIRCWTEGLQQMRVGGKARLRCPSATAYGEKGAPPFVLPDTPLVFEVELLLVIR